MMGYERDSEKADDDIRQTQADN